MSRLLCRLFGHREETTDVSHVGVKFIVTGCTRCDTVLDANAHYGQYPLPRRPA